jgi:hypothetical protein
LVASLVLVVVRTEMRGWGKVATELVVSLTLYALLSAALVLIEMVLVL